jgi:transketolase
VWPLLAAALRHRPALIAPFVTRPSEPVLDRAALGLPPAEAAATGVYALRRAKGDGDGTVVLQGSEVTYAFVQHTLPLLDREGVELNVYYVASAELFDLLPHDQRHAIFPTEHSHQAMGITGFTLPTMHRWIRSGHGRHHTLHPFRAGHFLGSGPGDMVVAEAGLDGASQFAMIMRYLKER